MSPEEFCLSFLARHNIEFERYEHEAVYTCEQASALLPDLPGVATKNLFLRDRKGKRHFLVVVSDETTVDLKFLGELLGAGKLSFASPDRLKAHLGIEPGSVSLLALISDSRGAVEVVVEKKVWSGTHLQCHPLVNTSTLVLSQDAARRVLEVTGHTVELID